VPPVRLLSVRVLTCSTRCTLQRVSASRSLAFVSCHHVSPLMRSLGSECPPFARFLCPHLSLPVCLKNVSAPRSFAYPSCPQLSLLCFPGSECPSLACSPPFRVLTCPSRCAFQEVSVPHWPAFFHLLTCSSRCALQKVSALPSLAFF